MSINTAFVGSIPENYDRYLGPVLFQPYAIDLADRVHVAENGAVLELACGTGIVTRHLRNRLERSVALTATDLNEAMLLFARGKFSADENVEWKQADAMELPFPDQCFDVVVCQFGLMFVPDKLRAVTEAFRVLKTGGRFVFNVWDAIEHNQIPNLAHEVIGAFFADNPPDFYTVPFSLYDETVIKSLLTAGGFKEIKISLLPMAATAESAQHLAKGLIFGNPIINAIRERDESKVDEVETATVKAIVERYGAGPITAKMRALVCEATRH